MAHQPFSLDVIEVNEPCAMEWNAMHGDDRRRFCDRCNLHVHDLSALTRDEATTLVEQNQGGLCVRFTRDVGGPVHTLDYQPAPPKRKSRLWLAASTLGGVAAAVLNIAWAGRKLPPTTITVAGALPPLSTTTKPTTQPATQPASPPVPHMLGKICFPVPTRAPSR